MSDSLRFHGATRLLCPWDFPGRNTGMGCHSLLQGIFPTQRSNPGLQRCWHILSHQGSPLWLWAGRSQFSLMCLVWVVACRMFCHCHSRGGWKLQSTKHKDPRGSPQTERMFYLVILSSIKEPKSDTCFPGCPHSPGDLGGMCECLSPGRKEQDLSVDPQNDPFPWHEVWLLLPKSICIISHIINRAFKGNFII